MNEKIDPITLRFGSKEAEAKYQLWNYQNSLTEIRILTLISVVIHLSLLVLDRIILEDDYFTYSQIRMFLLIPASILIYLTSFSAIYEKRHQDIISIVLFINGMSLAVGNYLYSDLQVLYFGIGAVMVIMFGFMFLEVSFVKAAAVAWVIIIVNVIVSILIQDDMRRMASEVSLLIISGIILTGGAYKMEKSRRESFSYLWRSLMKESQRNTAEQIRLNWLQNMAGFLRHEMRNAVTGVTTSLQLLMRKDQTAESSKYIERAKKSIISIDHLLDTASEATSIESSLFTEKRELIRVDKLIEDQLEKYRFIYPSISIDAEIDDDELCVKGKEERLVQILDNLVNNAIEHGKPGYPINIGLHKIGSICRLSVTDRGDPLPDDIQSIFELFVSYKASKTENSGFGLGLYIVKLIAEGYGGKVEVMKLSDPTGAEFRVSLPLAK